MKHTLDSLVETHFLSTQAAAFLRSLIHARQSIAISGVTPSGMTMLLGALLAEWEPRDYVVVCEETAELDLPCPTWTRRLAPRNFLGRPTLPRLVQDSLATRPDCLVVSQIDEDAVFADLVSARQCCLFTADAEDSLDLFARMVGVTILSSVTVNPTQVVRGFPYLAHVGPVQAADPDLPDPTRAAYRLLALTQVSLKASGGALFKTLFRYEAAFDQVLPGDVSAVPHASGTSGPTGTVGGVASRVDTERHKDPSGEARGRSV